MRAVDARGGLRLEREAAAVILLIAERRVDELHRHVDVERQMAREPHRAHRAAAQQAIEPEAPRDGGAGIDAGF